MVIGTAGHVDHGKTALIRALTGQDTDRLPEEKRRGISIDLGFAAFPLPSGRVAGIVDVPGHERFVHNMVAGVAGMDAVLLVVAADEGVMPQTREHLDILQLLGVRRGIVVLTKVDLCEPEWVDLVEEEVRAAVAGTFLADAPILRVSSVTGEGLEALKDAVDRLVPTVPARPESGYARLPVDRVFTAPGFGTVVTGTLLSGRVRGEDRLELLPAGRTVRVRQVQVHGQPVDAAVAGNRVALNLVGVERHEVARGDVLITPGALRAGDLLAVRVDVLARAPAPLRNEQRVRVHAGTAEVVARALVLDGEAVEPGAGGYVLFRAERPLVVARGDRILLRTLSPVATLGGGVVLDTGRRYRRGDAEGLRELALRASGRDEDIVGTILAAGRPVTPQAVARRVGAPLEAVLPVLESLVAAANALGSSRA
ncbi:MAG: selenocysteine-specific translation elongation factor, partial [Clostridia bacterium]|nr:selenocysteine-specific translation elongation factor [Clostridia bacterium]